MSWTIDLLMSMTVPGLAFEQEALDADQFDHLEERVKELLPARSRIQRQFYNPALKYKTDRDPASGEKIQVAVDAWSKSAKLRNAEGDLKRWIETFYIDAWGGSAAAMPPFILYVPETLKGQRLEFDAGQAGEFTMYDFADVGKAMIADGESRHHALDLVLSGAGRNPVSGSRREKLRSKIVPIIVFHGIDPTEMAQVFADLNGKGVVLSKVETVSRDTRDPWVKATIAIFDSIGVPLQTRGRQVTAASRHEGKHLMLNQAITMVRALGLGSVGGATSSANHASEIDFDRLAKAGTLWFGEVIEYFGTGPEIFSDPSRVIRSMPVKVALGVMGNAFYANDVDKQVEHRTSLKKVDWVVGQHWNGIAGKVSKGKEGNWKLAASGAKEVGNKAKTALCSAETAPGKLVRGVSE